MQHELASDSQEQRLKEITELHTQIEAYGRVRLDKGIRIGELLTEIKRGLKHGQWEEWIKANLPFTNRTARTYMREYRDREKLKSEGTSDLEQASSRPRDGLPGDNVGEKKKKTKRTFEVTEKGLDELTEYYRQISQTSMGWTIEVILRPPRKPKRNAAKEQKLQTKDSPNYGIGIRHEAADSIGQDAQLRQA